MRNLHPDTKAALSGDHIRARLVKFDYTPTPVFLTDAPFDISYNGDVYLGNGSLLGLGNLTQTIDIRVSSTTVTLDAVDPSLVAILLTTSQQSRAVNISLAILNGDYSVAGTPILMSSMIMDGMPKITDDPKKGKAIVRQKISSEFANWAAKNGRSTTPASQQKHFPGDTGLDFAPEAGKQYPWGRK